MERTSEGGKERVKKNEKGTRMEGGKGRRREMPGQRMRRGEEWREEELERGGEGGKCSGG